LNARKDQVTKISGLTNSDGTPYFSMRYVIERYLGMTDEDRLANLRAKEEAEKRKKEEEAKESGGETTENTGEEITL
jgi:hypothetical protein